MDRNISKKVRLFYLLPYGVISRQALELAIKVPRDAFVAYSSDAPMEERCRAFDNAHKAAIGQLERMFSSMYIEDTSRKFAKSHSSQFRIVRLTQWGFYLLTGTQDMDLEKQRFDHFHEQSYRKQKENTYESDELYDCQLREQWYVGATNPAALKVDRETLDAAFLEAVYNGNMTILALDTALAKEVNLHPSSINGWQTYRNWRLSNINALFMVNKFLTFLDRRPMNTNWKVHNVQSEEDFERLRENGNLDIPAFMYHALNKWYSEHPTSYLFAEPSVDLTDANKVEWMETPAFYSMAEIPGFYSDEKPVEGYDATGSKNVIRHSFCGVAVGKKRTYIVHHTRPRKTPWIESVERQTISIVSKEMEACEVPIFTAEQMDISNAIIVCPSVHQFANLFESTKKKISRKRGAMVNVCAPYDSISIVPLNASGAMQIRGLLLLTPNEYDHHLFNELQAADSRFERTQETVYQMTFEGVPVLVAHSMNFQKLYLAWEDYNDGLKFYVSCYPGQVKFIRKIMPDVEFL